MKIAVVLGAVLALASACKKKDAAAPANGSSAGSGSAASAAPADAQAAPEPPPGPAVLEMQDVDGESNPELLAAFGKQMPALPAINAAGTLLATLDDVSGGPAIPPAMQVTIRKFPSGDKAEELPILAFEEAMHAGESGDDWLTPELAKQLGTRGKAIVAKLAGFHSLHAVKLEQDDSSSYDVKPTKVADLVFAATIRDDEALALTLQTPQGKTVHRAQVDSYGGRETGDGIDIVCNYQPMMSALWTDPPKPRALYVETRYRFRDDCAEPDPDYLVWSTDPNSTTPEELATDLFARQLTTLADAKTSDGFALTNDELMPIARFSPSAKDHSDSNQSVTMSRDRKSAWASGLSVSDGKTKRISDLLVQTPDGWRIAALAFTDEKDNADVNRDAKAGKLPPRKFPESGDASLNAAFAKLTTDGATNVAKDLVAFGSGPGERTVGDTAFTKPWNAAWKGKTTIVSSVARLAPSGTTGWVAATVELQKKGYKIPFTVFAVFDKDASGAWTLVHIHFAV